MVFLIKATPSLDADLDCDLGRVVIGDKEAKELLGLKKIFDTAWSTSKSVIESELWEMYYFDSSIDFISYDKLYKHVGKSVKQMDPQHALPAWATFTGMTSIGVTAVERESTEVEQLIVRAAGVAWTAMVKHTQVYVTTEILPWSTIQALFITEKQQPKQGLRRAGSTSKSQKS